MKLTYILPDTQDIFSTLSNLFFVAKFKVYGFNKGTIHF